MSRPRSQPDDGVKHLSPENWLAPDEIGLRFGAVNLATGERITATGQGWAHKFLAVELDASVPGAVRDVWEVARGILLYGWFYYALYAVGEHQLRRVADVAVLYRYQQADGPAKKTSGLDGEVRWPDFKARVDWLVACGVVPSEKRNRWDAIRELRNQTTHASFRHLIPPHEAFRVRELIGGEIDALFGDRPLRG